jgi:hypothetical protein
LPAALIGRLTIKEAALKSPFISWSCGIFTILGLPLGVIVTIESGSALAGLGSAIAVVLVGLLVCNKDIIREYKESKRASARK